MKRNWSIPQRIVTLCTAALLLAIVSAGLLQYQAIERAQRLEAALLKQIQRDVIVARLTLNRVVIEDDPATRHLLLGSALNHAENALHNILAIHTSSESGWVETVSFMTEGVLPYSSLDLSLKSVETDGRIQQQAARLSAIENLLLKSEGELVSPKQFYGKFRSYCLANELWQTPK